MQKELDLELMQHQTNSYFYFNQLAENYLNAQLQEINMSLTYHTHEAIMSQLSRRVKDKEEMEFMQT